MSKDRMSNRRTDPTQDTPIDRSIHDLALDAVQVFEVEEITSCAARSAAPEGYLCLCTVPCNSAGDVSGFDWPEFFSMVRALCRAVALISRAI